MPIAFDLEGLRHEFNCETYLETGLYDPHSGDISCKQALRAKFTKLYSIEIREDWVERGREVFSGDLASGRLTLIRGDSTKLAAHLQDNPDFEKTVLFFLDAHVDNSNIHNYTKKCPLLEELNAIKTLAIKHHVICVDDMRIIREAFPWGETSYVGVNFEQEIRNIILSINPKYQFRYYDGVIPNDVLVAYVPKE